jgi:hypothetical protein
MVTGVSTLVLLRFRHDLPAPTTKYCRYKTSANLNGISRNLCEATLLIRNSRISDDKLRALSRRRQAGG